MKCFLQLINRIYQPQRDFTPGRLLGGLYPVYVVGLVKLMVWKQAAGVINLLIIN